MARGQRKTIEQKIEEKQAAIDALAQRMEKEQEELRALLEEQRMMKLAEIEAIIENADLSIEEVEQILMEHASHVA